MNNSICQEEQAGQETLVLENLGLVRAIAAGLRNSLPCHVEFDDLLQAGMLGLMDAARKYDPAQQSFSGYAKYRIRGAIIDSLRQGDSLSRDARQHQKRIQAVVAELERQQQREATAQEIAEALGMDLKRLGEIQTRLIRGSTVSPTAGNEDLPAIEFPAPEHMRPDALVARAQLAATVRDAIDTLPERYQTVLNFYYLEELTMREIASVMNVNESRVSQIHKRAVEMMAQQLRSKGVQSAAA